MPMSRRTALEIAFSLIMFCCVIIAVAIFASGTMAFPVAIPCSFYEIIVGTFLQYSLFERLRSNRITARGTDEPGPLGVIVGDPLVAKVMQAIPETTAYAVNVRSLLFLLKKTPIANPFLLVPSDQIPKYLRAPRRCRRTQTSQFPIPTVPTAEIRRRRVFAGLRGYAQSF